LAFVFPLSHWHVVSTTEHTEPVSAQSFDDELWSASADPLAVHEMQSPGSIFGRDGENTSVPSNSTVVVYGVARLVHCTGGVVLKLQFAVLHPVCACTAEALESRAAAPIAIAASVLAHTRRVIRSSSPQDYNNRALV